MSLLLCLYSVALPYSTDGLCQCKNAAAPCKQSMRFLVPLSSGSWSIRDQCSCRPGQDGSSLGWLIVAQSRKGARRSLAPEHNCLGTRTSQPPNVHWPPQSDHLQRPPQRTGRHTFLLWEEERRVRCHSEQLELWCASVGGRERSPWIVTGTVISMVCKTTKSPKWRDMMKLVVPAPGP